MVLRALPAQKELLVREESVEKLGHRASLAFKDLKALLDPLGRLALQELQDRRAQRERQVHKAQQALKDLLDRAASADPWAGRALLEQLDHKDLLGIQGRKDRQDSKGLSDRQARPARRVQPDRAGRRRNKSATALRPRLSR